MPRKVSAPVGTLSAVLGASAMRKAASGGLVWHSPGKGARAVRRRQE
jgi:hypothetical protein